MGGAPPEERPAGPQSGKGEKDHATGTTAAAPVPVASGAGVTVTAMGATSPRAAATGMAAGMAIHQHHHGAMRGGEGGGRPGLHIRTSPLGGRRSPSPALLQRANSSPASSSSSRAASPVDAGLLSPTQPPYRSVSHIVGYTPEGSTSRCRVCERGFTPGKLR